MSELSEIFVLSSTDPLAVPVLTRLVSGKHVPVFVAYNKPRTVYHSRNVASAKTEHPGDDSTPTNSMFFTAEENVTKVTVAAEAEVAAGLQTNEKYLVLVNSVTAALAKTNLEDPGSASTDVIYYMGSQQEDLEITADGNVILRIDFLPLKVAMRFVGDGENYE